MVVDASWMPFDKFSEDLKFFEDWQNSEYFRRLKKTLRNDHISEYFKRRDGANQILRSGNMRRDIGNANERGRSKWQGEGMSDSISKAVLPAYFARNPQFVRA